MSAAPRGTPSAGQARDPSIELVERVVAMAGREPRKALQLARKALAESSRMPSMARGRLLRAHAHALRAIGKYAEARRAYRRSRGIFQSLGEHQEWALGAIGLVDACMYLGFTDEALAAANGARPVFQRLRDRRRLAMLETNVGNLFHREERPEEALVHYERAAGLLVEVGSPAERALVDHNRANVFILLGRRREAETAFHRARDIFERHGEKVLAAQTRYGLACLRFLSGEYAAAITELEQVRPELQRIGARPLLALADLDLAEVLLSIRLLPEALALARSASRWFTTHGVPIDRARCLLVTGTALTLLQQPDAATRTLSAAARLFRSQRSLTGSAAVAMARAQLALQEGRPGSAVRHARVARRIFVASGLGLRAMTAGAMTAEALLGAGRTETARNFARHVRREAKRPGDAYSRARLARVEGAAAARTGDIRASLAHYREALAHASRAQSSLFVDEWRVGFLDGEPALLDEALGVMMRRRPRPQAEEVWRWLCEPAMRGRMGKGARPPAVGPLVRQRTKALRQELEACYARLWQPHTSGKRLMGAVATRSLEQRALRLESGLRRLAVGAPSRRGSLYSTREGGPAAGVVRLRYFSANGQLCAVRWDSRGMSLACDLAPMEEVGRHVRLFHYQMALLSSAAPALREHRDLAGMRAQQHLTALSERLLDPVLGDGETPRELRIVPYGPLFRVPWHAVPWRSAPLVRACGVTLESFGVDVPAQPPGNRTGALVLGFGDAKTSGIETEAREVSKALRSGGVAVRELVGPAAIRDAAIGAVAEVAVVHLAGHALYREEHPEFSALRLSDGWLHARDLAEMGFDGACVVLSACETGPRGAVAGDQMLGLVRGLAQAGARTMVTSLWKVDDRGTLALMKRLYHEWRCLGRLGPALNKVQRDSAAEGVESYLWAPFCLIGDPDVAWPAEIELQKSLRRHEDRSYT